MSEVLSIRPYSYADFNAIVNLIKDHDQDDAENAEDTLSTPNTKHFVGEWGGEIVAVSGYECVPETDGTAYLSWTYVHHNYLRRGFGAQILDHCIDQANLDDLRLLFVKISDYTEHGKLSIYAAARQLYLSRGFETKIKCKDFYDSGESLEILGKRLKAPVVRPPIKEEKPNLKFCELIEISETNGTYTFAWKVPSLLRILGPRNFTIQDIKVGLDAARAKGARIVLLTFPSNLPLIHRPLQAAGFKHLGDLTDYYEEGLDEMMFIYVFNGEEP